MSTEIRLNDQIRDSQRTWLVTGAAGFIGSHLVDTLLRLDQRVTGLDNYTTGRPQNISAVLEALEPRQRANFNLIVGDIRHKEACQAACRHVDVVLHQAALGSVPRSIAFPEEAHGTNLNGFLNMLLAARDAGVPRFVYASSSACYGDTPHLPMEEDISGKPLSPYAATKRADELYAQAFGQNYGLNTVGLRYFNVFGPRQDPAGAYAAVIPRWITAMLRGTPVLINGDGTTSRDFCYVGNVVRANLRAATTDKAEAGNEVFNVAQGGRTTLNELFEQLRLLVSTHRADALDHEPVYRDFRQGDIPRSEAAIDKARALLGYQPKWEMREGLKWTVDWYAEHLDDDRRAPLPQASDPLAASRAAASKAQATWAA